MNKILTIFPTYFGILLLGLGSLLINVQNYLGMAGDDILNIVIYVLIAVGLEVGKLKLAPLAFHTTNIPSKIIYTTLASIMLIMSIGSMGIWLDRNLNIGAQEKNNIAAQQETKETLLIISKKFEAMGYLTKSMETLNKIKDAKTLKNTATTLPFMVGSLMYWAVILAISICVDVGCIALLISLKAAHKPVTVNEELTQDNHDENLTSTATGAQGLIVVEIMDRIVKGAHGETLLESIKKIAAQHKTRVSNVSLAMDNLMARGLVIKNQANRFQLNTPNLSIVGT